MLHKNGILLPATVLIGCRKRHSYRLNMKLKYITLLFSTAFLMLGVACGGAAQPEVDIEATVEARVQAALEATALSIPTATPAPARHRSTASRVRNPEKCGSTWLPYGLIVNSVREAVTVDSVRKSKFPKFVKCAQEPSRYR